MSRDRDNSIIQSAGFTVGMVLCGLLGLYFASSALYVLPDGPAVQIADTINPNDAPVASLVRLPGIGLTRARAIVTWRQSAAGGERSVFRCPEDLQRVPGIGPATVRGMQPWLRFGVPSPAETDAGADPSGRFGLQ